jgi:hypothetical protein
MASLVPESNAGIEEQQDDDDREVFPVLNRSRERGGDLDHPGDRPPEVGEELAKRVRPPFLNAVLAVGGEPSPRLIGS